jgi:uncharacterized protein (TIGR02266 family)
MDQPSSTESNALTLRIKFKSASLEEFISRYGVDVSPGGIFIRTKQPVDVGTTLQFDFTLADGSSLLTGLGTVAWVRENDPTRTNNVPGMGLRFDKLTPESQQRHQTILAEKARKEGKPQGTPYPPTTFVAPASRPSPAPEPAAAPDDAIAKQEAPVKTEPSPANFAKTLPLPAPAAALAASAQASVSEADEFEAGGKTEISDKPIEDLMREAEAAQQAASPPAFPLAEDFAPKSPLEDWKTDAHTLEGVEAPPAPEEVSLSDSQAYATGVPEPPPAVTDSGERRPSGKQYFASLLDMGDTAETLAAGQASAVGSAADTSSGVPIAEAVTEKTEEVSLLPAKAAEEIGEPLDLGTASAEDEVEEVPSLAETEAALQPEKRKRSSVLVVGAVLLAGAAAFAAVYLLQMKPWERSGGLEGSVAIVKKPPAAVPLPGTPPTPAEKAAAAPRPTLAEKAAAAEEHKAAAAEEAAEKKPAAKEDKQAAAVAAEKAAAEKAAAEKAAAEKVAAEKAAAEKVAAEKARAEKVAAEKHASTKVAAEKLVVAKAEPEAPAPKSTSKAAAKAAAKPSAEPASAEKRVAVDEEEIYRLAFRSVPIGAEVLIDNEYYARTPCERRILDPKKSLAITIRREGYESHERLIGSSDNWVKKGNERVLSISVNLKKIKTAESESAGAVGGGEAKPVVKPASDEPYKE